MSRLDIEDRFHVVVLKWPKLIHHLTLGHSFMGFDHHDLEDAILRDCVRDVSGQTRQRDIYRVVFAGYTADETVNDAELLGVNIADCADLAVLRRGRLRCDRLMSVSPLALFL